MAEDVSLEAKEKVIKNTERKENRILFIILLLKNKLILFYAYFRYLQQENSNILQTFHEVKLIIWIKAYFILMNEVFMYF